MKNYVLVAVCWVVSIVAVVLYVKFNSKDTTNNELAKLETLEKNTKKIRTFDSLNTANLNRFLDSVQHFEIRLNNKIQELHDQNNKMLNRTNDLKKRFDSVIVPSRPNF